MKVNVKYSNTAIESSDTKIEKSTDDKLCFRLYRKYRKPTGRRNYLHFKSAHPSYLKKVFYTLKPSVFQAYA